ncbi:MAG: hypothetical protein NC089_12900 [Bacteroides sp.]|nr:hypothetical protein [Bacteroides sp.]MCM1550786.1 hypothetical protein [Clostridium sp.]
MDNNYNNMNQNGPVYVDPSRPPAPSQGKAVAGLGLGIASILFGCTGIMSLICSIIGLILCSQMKKEAGEMSGMGKAGMVLNIIGLVIGILGILFWLILILFGDWEVSTYY